MPRHAGSLDSAVPPGHVRIGGIALDPDHHLGLVVTSPLAELLGDPHP